MYSSTIIQSASFLNTRPRSSSPTRLPIFSISTLPAARSKKPISRGDSAPGRRRDRSSPARAWGGRPRDRARPPLPARPPLASLHALPACPPPRFASPAMHPETPRPSSRACPSLYRSLSVCWWRKAAALRRTREQPVAQPRVAGERRRPLELDARFRETAELEKQIGARARQQRIRRERRLGPERVDQRQPRGRTVGHRHRHRPVERYHRRRRARLEHAVQRRDARPIGGAGLARSRVTRGDRRLQLVG